MSNRQRVYHYCTENIKGDGTTPPFEQIAKDLGISVRTVRFCITWLKNNGYIAQYGYFWNQGAKVLKGLR